MNWKFFTNMSECDAKQYFDNFLAEERTAVDELIKAVTQKGYKADFSLQSLVPVLWFARNLVKQVPVEPDPSIPDWLRKMHESQYGFAEFDESSRIWILRIAYYLGQTFVQNIPGLKWSIGNPKYAEKNMPVVAGFQHEIEMAPMLIIENMMIRTLQANNDEIIQKMVEAWLAKAPANPIAS